jgi:DNA-binding MarR family transcriptional regulator
MRRGPGTCILLTERRVRNPDSPTLMEGLAQALSRAERSLTGRLSQALEREGCSVEQWRILVLLADGKGHPMSEIAEFALVPAPSLTRMVDRMATDGLVHRTVDARDRRRVLVHLTREGRALHRCTTALVEQQGHALLANAARADLQRLQELLEALAGRIR